MASQSRPIEVAPVRQGASLDAVDGIVTLPGPARPSPGFSLTGVSAIEPLHLAGRRRRAPYEIDRPWRGSYPAEMLCDTTGLTMRSAAGWPRRELSRQMTWQDIAKVTLRRTGVGEYVNVHGCSGVLRMRVSNVQAAAARLREVIPASVTLDLQPARGRRVLVAEAVTLAAVLAVILALVVLIVGSH